MKKLVICGFLALLAAAPSLATAQTPKESQGVQGEARDLTDVRIDVLKRALQLSPEQMKLWPAIENAIRGRAEDRRERLKDVAARTEDAQADRDLIKVMQNRADNLSERATELRKLADAWQPLYATLSDDQKRRMRILERIVFRGAREDLMARRMERMEDEESSGAVTGPGSGEGGVAH